MPTLNEFAQEYATWYEGAIGPDGEPVDGYADFDEARADYAFTGLDWALALGPAISNMADSLSQVFAESLGHFTCSEVETICAVFEAAGQDGAAICLRVAHAAYDDEPGDLHHGYTDPDEDA